MDLLFISRDDVGIGSGESIVVDVSLISSIHTSSSSSSSSSSLLSSSSQWGYHCRSLGPQCAHGLEDINDAFILHSLKNNWQRDEDAGPADARAVGKKRKLGFDYYDDDDYNDLDCNDNDDDIFPFYVCLM